MRRILAVLTVLGVLAVSVYYVTQRRKPGPPSTAIPEIVLRMPADATLLFYADVSALRSSPSLARLAALLTPSEKDRDYAEFVGATGFDYTRDLDRVVVARRSSAPPSTIALAEGRFDRERIRHYALRSGKQEKQNGAEVFVVPSSGGSKVTAFTFLNENTILLANDRHLAPLLAALRQHREPNVAPAMRERLARAARSPVFLVGHLDPGSKELAIGAWRSQELGKLLGSVRWFTFVLQSLGEKLLVAAEGECGTADDARQLAGTLEALRWIGLAALADSKTRQRLDPATASLLDVLLRAGRISHDDRRVQVTFELMPEELQPLLTTPGSAFSTR